MLQPAIHAALRASARSASTVHLELKRGFSSLATIAFVAPGIGVFGTVLGIVNAFPGFDGEKSAIFGLVTGLLSEAIVPTAFGLLVGLLALWFYRYLNSKVEAFDLEMESAALELANRLSRIASTGAG